MLLILNPWTRWSPARQPARRASLGKPRWRRVSFRPPWRGRAARAGAVADPECGTKGRGRRCGASTGDAIGDAAAREVAEDLDRDVDVTISRSRDDRRWQVTPFDDANRIERATAEPYGNVWLRAERQLARAYGCPNDDVRRCADLLPRGRAPARRAVARRPCARDRVA